MMSQWFKAGMVVLVLALAGCSLTTTRITVTATPSPTNVTGPTARPTSTAAPPVQPDLTPTLAASTGPYADAVGLLDDVCFEYLHSLGGRTWVWESSAELDAFYDQAEEVCGRTITRGTFAFDGEVLVGAVSLATGCDAAHQFLDLRTDDAQATQTLVLRFVVQPGCPYELVQLLLIAVPHPPTDYELAVEVVRDPD
jgi:hypothetical protein